MTRSQLNAKIAELSNKVQTDRVAQQLMCYKKRLRSLDKKKWNNNPNKKVYIWNNPNVEPLSTLEFIKSDPMLRQRFYRKKLTLTADFVSTLSRTIEVDYDFDPKNCDLDDAWYKYTRAASNENEFSDEELKNILKNLQMNEVWLVRDSKDNEVFVK